MKYSAVAIVILVALLVYRWRPTDPDKEHA